MPTTQYLATAENSGTFDSIMPAQLVGRMFDDGFAQNGSIDRALDPLNPGSYCRPPYQPAFEALADVGKARGISITVHAEELYRYAYGSGENNWVTDNADCRAVIADVAQGLTYMKAHQPSVDLYVGHMALLAQSLATARPQWAAFIAFVATSIGALIAGTTTIGYFGAPSVGAIDYAGWDAEQDFYLSEFATYFPGKRNRIIASSYLLGPEVYVGDTAMQHVLDYAEANDCDVEWWSASATAPMHAEAWQFLGVVGQSIPGGDYATLVSAGGAFAMLKKS